jgi:hypothetical protein
MFKSKQVRAGKLPKEQYELAKKKEAERIARIEKDPRYIQKMDEELLNEYDFDYQGRKEMAQKRQKAMQSNPRLYEAWKRQNDKRNEEFKAQQEYEREQERLREEAEEKARRKASDPLSNILSGLSTVASLIPGAGSAISTGLDVLNEGQKFIRDATGGKLNKRKPKVKGAGLFDIFTPNKSYNNVSTKTMKQYGDFPVIQLRIMRTPIMKILNTVINVISLGKWNDLLKKHSYDDLFHLALVATVQTPTEQKQIVMEKNEVINISTKFTVNDKTETLEVPLNGKETTVNKMLADGLQTVGVDKWFLYHPLNNNCQSFISYILQTLGLYNMQTRTFLYQNMEAIKQELPSYVKTIMKATTDIGAVASKLMGKGLEGGYQIHSVKVNKKVPFEEALKHFHNITKNNKKSYYKEMKNHYNFRNIPKTKFEAKSYRTKKINPQISIIFGKLKN